MRVAAIDCGTNSVRLLIADVDSRGDLREIDRQMRIVRLGEGVDRTGEFARAALDRLFDACADYARAIAESGAESVRFIATSASRDVGNRGEFVDGVRRILGVEPEVVSGREEAALSYRGALLGLPGSAPPGPVLVVDIGGGSTEFVLGTPDGARIDASVSVDIGCVRMTERHLHDDPPTPGEVARARADIAAALDRAAEQVPLAEAATLIGLAGTVTTMGALALGLPSYDPERLHGSRLPAPDVRRITERLVAATRAERLAEPVMHPGRADVIAGGALILEAIVDRLRVLEVVVSECDILDGIARAQVPHPTP